MLHTPWFCSYSTGSKFTFPSPMCFFFILCCIFYISFAQQNLTMLRFPYGNICFLFPLANEQSSPEKLMRDLEKAKQVRAQIHFKTAILENNSRPPGTVLLLRPLSLHSYRKLSSRFSRLGIVFHISTLQESISSDTIIMIIICLSFHQVVITETRRVDTTWIVNGELTDRPALSDELADFCAQYPIYHVKKARESLEVTGIQGETIEFSVLTIN